MANLRDIRNRISSVNNTQQITKAMKMVAAAKLRKAQDRMIQTRPYANTLANIIGRLIQGQEITHPLLRELSESRRSLVIVVGSDRGLCGGFNNNLFKEVELFIANNFENGKENETKDNIKEGQCIFPFVYNYKNQYEPLKETSPDYPKDGEDRMGLPEGGEELGVCATSLNENRTAKTWGYFVGNSARAKELSSVNTASNRNEAENFVQACMYPPKGYRSFGPI